MMAFNKHPLVTPMAMFFFFFYWMVLMFWIVYTLCFFFLKSITGFQPKNGIFFEYFLRFYLEFLVSVFQFFRVPGIFHHKGLGSVRVSIFLLFTFARVSRPHEQTDRNQVSKP